MTMGGIDDRTLNSKSADGHSGVRATADIRGYDSVAGGVEPVSSDQNVSSSTTTPEMSSSAKDASSPGSGRKGEGKPKVALKKAMSIRVQSRRKSWSTLQPEVIRAEFDAIANKDTHLISQFDMKRALERLGLKTTMKQVIDIMTKSDRNNDGYVDFEEFKAYVQSRQADIEAAFDALDSNMDGVITDRELHEAVSSLGLRAGSEDIHRLLKKMDSDDSGAIDFNEFRHFLMLLPDVNLNAVFEQFMHGIVDVGESASIPPDLKRSHTATVGPLSIMLAGGIAGAISRTATAPMDRLKVILQAGKSTNGPQVTGVLQGIKEIYRSSGWRGFFRGNGANVLKIAPESATKFLSYDLFKTRVAADVDNITMAERLLAGSCAGALSQFLIYPMEITKTRLALASEQEYSGIRDCIVKIREREGVRALYRGLGASLTGIVPYAGVDLAVFNFLKDSYVRSQIGTTKEPSVVVLLSFGALSSTLGQLVAYPLNLVRTRLQAQGMHGRPVIYSGMVDCFQKTLHEEGVKGLYRGLLPNFMKAIPAISISYAVFESLKREMSKAKWSV